MGLRALLTGLSASLCIVSLAHAADVGPGGLKDAPYAVVQWNWTGLYGGMVGGYGSGDSRNYVSANANNRHGWANNNPDGVLLGGTVGYNWQYAPNLVLGVESDMSWSGMEGNQHLYVYDGHDWSGGWDGFGTLRGRAGYAIGPNLIYGTAGLAFLHANETIVGNDANESNFAQGWRAGYVVGVGYERAVTNELSVKGEYLFASGFANWSGQTGTVNAAGNQTYQHIDSDINIIRVGLNYKFF